MEKKVSGGPGADLWILIALNKKWRTQEQKAALFTKYAGNASSWWALRWRRLHERKEKPFGIMTPTLTTRIFG